MALQKIIKVGNSVAVTLPAEYVKKKKIRPGDRVMVETADYADMVLIRPKLSTDKITLTPEFFEWLEGISNKYEKTIKELAHR